MYSKPTQLLCRHLIKLLHKHPGCYMEGAGLGEPSAGEVAWPGRRRVAGGLAHGRRWTGEGEEQREERERQRNLIKSNFEFFSTISNHTQKVLNTKGVPSFKPYHFCFKFTFIWDSNQKLNLKTDECT